MTPPRLRRAGLDDYEQIVELERSHGMETRSKPEWLDLWRSNPVWERVADRWPTGWVLEDSEGRIVGSVVNFPTLYRFQGRELVCANGRAWVAADPHRGYAPLLMEEYFAQPADLFVNTTVGEAAVAVIAPFTRPVPAGDWLSVAYWVTNYEGFAERVLQRLRLPPARPLRRAAAGSLRARDRLTGRRLPSAPPFVTLAEADGFDSRFDAFWEELAWLHPGRLLAQRDRETLAWHYAVPLRRGRLKILTASRGERLRAWCVLKRQELAGALPRVRLVDYQTVEQSEDLLPGLLGAARSWCEAQGVCKLEHLGCGLPKMQSLDRHAPYRYRIGVWPFYGHAADPALDTALRDAAVWDPSAYDGDASLE